MRFIVFTIVLLIAAADAEAAQRVTTDPDGTIRFNASTTGVTRISVAGDRIRRIVNDGSAFEMSNDEETGDVFFRSSGEADGAETGYIVTERGVTIGYRLTPVARTVEPVLVTIRGQAAETEEVGEFETGVGFSDNIASAMSEIIREVAAEHVIGKSPTGRDGRIVARASGEGWRARVQIAAAGQVGRLVREQDFYSAPVRAVWIARPTLGPEERTFVVIVEERS